MSERKVRAYSSYSRDALIPPAAGEGVAWLGRQPWAEASLSYRALRFTLRVGLGAFGMRVRAVGLERIATSGPRILVGAPHRRYYEAFALGIAAPAAQAHGHLTRRRTIAVGIRQVKLIFRYDRWEIPDNSRVK